jgi:hypothetical protein
MVVGMFAVLQGAIDRKFTGIAFAWAQQLEKAAIQAVVVLVIYSILVSP